MEKSMELVFQTSVLCPRLQTSNSDREGVAAVQVDALVQAFKDGHTRVFCGVLQDDCKTCDGGFHDNVSGKKKEGPCLFVADPEKFD